MSGEDASSGDKPNFSGKYTLLRNEGLEEFLAANGANWFIRKMATSSSPSLDVTQEGDKFYFRLYSMVMNRETRFTVGEEYEETQMNGAVMKVTPSWDGKKLVQKYEPKNPDAGKAQVHTREIDGDELTLTLQVENVVCKRVFKKSE